MSKTPEQVAEEIVRHFDAFFGSILAQKGITAPALMEAAEKSYPLLKEAIAVAIKDHAPEPPKRRGPPNPFVTKRPPREELEALVSTMSVRQIAEKYEVKPETVKAWYERYGLMTQAPAPGDETNVS